MASKERGPHGVADFGIGRRGGARQGEAPEPRQFEHQAPWEEGDAVHTGPPVDEPPPDAQQADDAEAA